MMYARDRHAAVRALAASALEGLLILLAVATSVAGSLLAALLFLVLCLSSLLGG